MRLAYALRARGKDVAVVVKSKHILSQMLDKDAADILQKRMESNGVRILLGRDAKEITGKGRVEGVILGDGKVEPCGIVVIGKGVSANTGLAAKTSIKTHWGIIVNEYMETSEKDIYAAGDVAETIDIARDEPGINALWPCAVEQGRIAGLNMAGEKTRYKGSLSMNSVEFFGLPAVSIGITEPGSEGFEILKKTDGENYRMAALKNMISQLGIEPERLKLEWISASEGPIFQKTINGFIDQITSLGPLNKAKETAAVK